MPFILGSVSVCAQENRYRLQRAASALTFRAFFPVDRLVVRTGHMLFLNISNLRVKLPCKFVRIHVPVSLVEKLSLLFACNNGEIIHFGFDISLVFIVVFAHGIVRVTVMGNCWSSGFYLGLALNYRIIVAAFQIIIKATVTIEVVEVFKQCEVQRLPYVWIRLIFSKVCS